MFPTRKRCTVWAHEIEQGGKRETYDHPTSHLLFCGIGVVVFCGIGVVVMVIVAEILMTPGAAVWP